MHIFFSVGEPSGDLHAARLVQELRRRDPTVRASGFGGPKMAAEGCRLLYRLTDLAVMGVIDVVPLLWRFFKVLGQARRFLTDERPDAVVLVDFPGFNWWVARLAKRRGIPVFYYLPPQMWAWAPWRVRKMRRLVDLVLCCLPFEERWYRSRGVPTRFVGHPFFDEAAEKPLDRPFLQRYGSLADKRQIVGVLPGSRNYEIKQNFGIQLQVLAEVHRRHPGVRFLVACYREEHRQSCREWLDRSGQRLPLEFHVGKTSEIVELAAACLMVSGSVSLELLARRTPAVVLYHVGRLHGWIGKLVLTCPFITLTNLIAGREVMPEFVIAGRVAAAVDEMIEALSGWLEDESSRAGIVDELTRLGAGLAAPGATAAAATAILERLDRLRPIKAAA
ncbi:MAG: lipid-A-disaccharide synthase [Planctomycetaceae bacterium]